MRIYPDTPNERGRTVARDALTLLALFVLAWLALKVHDTVDKLAVLGTGVRDSGNAVQDGFGAAADAVSGVPVVGGEFGDALRDAGAGTGGNVADAGQRRRGAHPRPGQPAGLPLLHNPRLDPPADNPPSEN